MNTTQLLTLTTSLILPISIIIGALTGIALANKLEPTLNKHAHHRRARRQLKHYLQGLNTSIDELISGQINDEGGIPVQLSSIQLTITTQTITPNCRILCPTLRRTYTPTNQHKP